MEDFVPFELAVKLKEKGFNIPFYFYYRMDDKCLRHANITNPLVYGDEVDDEVVIAPTISQVLKWLREEKNFHLMVYILNDSSEDADGRIIQEWFFWSFVVQNCNSGDYAYEGDDVEYESYEKASIAGIEYVLDKLI